MNSPKLSKRLQTIYDMISFNNVIADIGSDHALLPIALVLNGKVTRAYASEVNEGPYEASVKNIQKYGVENYVIPVLSNGIKDLGKDVTSISICGMGGSLIADILNKDKEKLDTIKELILEPNNNEESVRIWLMNNGYKIDEEKIIEEDKKNYEIIKAIKGEAKYNKEQLFFGPLLLEEKNEIFIKKWKDYKEYLQKVLININDKESSNYRLIESIKTMIDNML